MTELRGRTWNHPRGLRPMLATAEAYAEVEPRVRVRWDAHSLQDFASAPVDVLAAECDLMVIDHPHLGSASGALVPLDTVVDAAALAEIRDLAVGPSYESYRYDGHLWALPVDAAAQVACHRPDLLPDGDVPTSWSGVADLVDRGRVLWPLKPIDAVCSFLSLAAGHGTPAVTADGTFATVDDAAAVLERLARLTAGVPDRCHEANPIEVLDELASDQDTYAYVPLAFGYTNYSRAGYARRRLRAADAPAPARTLLGGAGLAVSASCRDVAAAVGYATWVASAAVQRTTYVVEGGQPASGWDDPVANALTDGFFTRTRRTLETSWLRPRSAGFVAFQDAAGPLVSGFLRGAGTARGTATRLAAEYRRCVPSPG